jgi:hypothetical protein
MVALNTYNEAVAALLNTNDPMWKKEEWGDAVLDIRLPKGRVAEFRFSETYDGNGYCACSVYCSEEEQETRHISDRLLNDFFSFVPQNEQEASRIVENAFAIADRPTDEELDVEEEAKDVEETLWHALNLAENGKLAGTADGKPIEKCGSKELRAHSVELIKDYMSDMGKENLDAEETAEHKIHVKLTFPDYQSFVPHEEELKDLAERIGAEYGLMKS